MFVQFVDFIFLIVQNRGLLGEHLSRSVVKINNLFFLSITSNKVNELPSFV